MRLRCRTQRTYFAPWSDTAGKAAFYRQIAQNDIRNIEDVQARYGKTDFDIHPTWGMRDTFIPAQQGRDLHDLLHAKTFTEIPDAAHMVHEDAPAALLGALMQHL